MTSKIVERIQEQSRWRPTGDESEGEVNRRTFDRDKFNEVSATMAKLIDLTNTMGCEEQVICGIVEGIVQSHRFLQGKGIVAILQALGEFGGLPEGQFTDARNSFAHRLCGLLRERFKDELFWKD